MSLPSSDMSGAEHAPGAPRKRRLGRWRVWLTLLALALIVALASMGGQWLSQRQNSMIPGRPLSYPQTHLHTIVMSTRPGVVYLGTHYGLFTSTDGGQTWPQSQGDLHTSMITAIAVSPSNPDLIAVLAVPTASEYCKGRHCNDGRDKHAGQDDQDARAESQELNGFDEAHILFGES